MRILVLPSYTKRDGSWKEAASDELLKLIGLFIGPSSEQAEKVEFQNVTRAAKLNKNRCIVQEMRSAPTLHKSQELLHRMARVKSSSWS